MGTEFQLCKIKRVLETGDWMHNNVNGLSCAFKNGDDAKFMLHANFTTI